MRRGLDNCINQSNSFHGPTWTEYSIAIVKCCFCEVWRTDANSAWALLSFHGKSLIVLKQLWNKLPVVGDIGRNYNTTGRQEGWQNFNV